MREEKAIIAEQEILDRLIAWGKAKDDVRAMILTSSRANPDVKIDRFSDYDPILVVTDIRQYMNDEWLGDFSKVLVVYHDPVKLEYGFERFCYVTQYESGLKIDFTLWPVGLLRKIIELEKLPDYLDIGYKILLDKDDTAIKLKPPSYQAFIPKIPNLKEYYEVVEGFFLDATYVAKHIWRHDLIPLKYEFELIKFENLRTMLEWRMEIDHGWSVKPGAYGKGLQKYVGTKYWARLETTYVGAGSEENWKALLETFALFRDVAIEVAKELGFKYPSDLDEQVMKYLKLVQDTP
jgi:aminoglycoside 6-adenylyltransferase